MADSLAAGVAAEVEQVLGAVGLDVLAIFEIADEVITDAGQLVLSAFEEAEPVPDTAIPIGEEPGPRPRKERKKGGSRRKKPALITLPVTPIEPEGECLGGRYHWVNELDQALTLLHSWTDRRCWAAVDLETGAAWRERPDPETGEPERYYPSDTIDPLISPIFLMSVSVEPGVAIVFDWRTLIEHEEFLDAVRRFLTTCGIVAHNSMFEQTFFLTHLGILANMVYDTAIVSQVTNAGLPPCSNLESVMDRTLGLAMEKGWQKEFLKLDPASPLPNEAIQYSAGDVCRLLDVMKALHAELKTKELLHIWTEVERPLLKWMAIARVEGLALDMQILEEIRIGVAARMEEERNTFAVMAPDVLITSPVQIKRWLNNNGWKVSGTDEKKVLAPMLAKDPDSVCGRATRVLLDFREMHKLLTTYLLPMMNVHPSPATGRMHPFWKQCGASDTGRMSCAEPNFQNIPVRTELGARIRTAIIPKIGHALVWADYSQFEVRALAEQANEVPMIRIYEEAYQVRQELEARLVELGLPRNWADQREKDKEKTAKVYEEHPEIKVMCDRLDDCDFHRRTAAALYKKSPKEVTKQERAAAKTLTFQIPYGSTPAGIAEKMEVPVEEAERLVQKYYLQFPQVDKYLKSLRKKAAIKGCTMSPFGRKRFYSHPDQRELYERFKAQKAEHDQLWAEFEAKLPTLTEKERKNLSVEEYRAKKGPKTDWARSIKNSWTQDPLELAKRRVKRDMAGIERQGTNQPIQSCNADATKIATILAGPRLQALHPECKIIGWVHDEILVTSPVEVAQEAATILEASMIEAARRIVTRCPIEVSVQVGNHWEK
jgi:DNA polymerase I-like protein with 3'-5' exonuclease and polymerase domains